MSKPNTVIIDFKMAGTLRARWSSQTLLVVRLLISAAAFLFGKTTLADWNPGNSNQLFFGDAGSACNYQFQTTYSQAPDYLPGGTQFFTSSGSSYPSLAQCTYNLNNPTFGAFEAPQLFAYALLNCQPGTTPSALSDSGCIPVSGVSGSQSGGPAPVGQNATGKDCTDCTVGDPINPVSGNEFIEQNDYRSASDFPLEFTRYYNSDSSTVSSLIGLNWRHTYDRQINYQPTQAGALVTTARRPDGRIVTFTSTDGTSWTSVTTTLERLTRLFTTAGLPNGWIYKTADDLTESYDVNGMLQQVADRTGRSQILTYTGSQLTRVSDSYGRALTFTYDTSGRMFTVTDPAGKTLTYSYDAAGNLSKVTYQDTTTRQYLYNEPAYTGGANLPHALTGVIDENLQRYETISYDSSGRGTGTSLGTAGANAFSLQYPPPGGTTFNVVVTDPLGTKRTLSYGTVNNQFRLSSFSSSGSEAACGLCAQESAVSYDANGYVRLDRPAFRRQSVAA